MAKGNHTNHPKVYARDEDLKELKDKFISFIENDFKHLTNKVSYNTLRVNFVLALLGVIIALLSIVLVVK